MAIVRVPFTPLPGQGFVFAAVFDGQSYQVAIQWNAFGQRWYMAITATGNTLVVCKALIASPDDYDINILAGYFVTSTMVYRASSQTFEIGP